MAAWVRAGNRRAFERLWRRHEPRLRAIARRRLPYSCSMGEEVEDVLQEVSCAAYVGICIRQTFKPGGPGSLGRWLDSICRNKVRDVYRRRARRCVACHVPDLDLGRLPDPEPGLTPVGLRYLYRVAADPELLLIGLPQPERAAFRSVVLRGKSAALVAEQEEVSVRTIQRRVREATAKVKILIRFHTGG